MSEQEVSEPTVYTAEYVWPVGGGPSETPMGEKFVRLSEYERLRALLDPDNDEAVMCAAQAVYDADLVAGLSMTDCERIVDAVLAALRKEAEQ